MDPTKLKSLIDDLHNEISDATHIPEALVTKVTQVVAEMEDLLSPEETSRDEEKSPLDRLEEHALEFDAEHPKISAALRQISAALSGIGI